MTKEPLDTEMPLPPFRVVSGNGVSAKRRRANRKNGEGSRDKNTRHGLYRLRKVGWHKWPGALARIYCECVSTLEGLPHLGPEHKMLIEATAEVYTLKRYCLDCLLSASVLDIEDPEQRHFLPLLKVYNQLLASQRNLLIACGLTPLQKRQFAAEPITAAEILSSNLEDIDVED